MTRPTWLTGTTIRWILVAAMLLVVVGVKVRRRMTARGGSGTSTAPGANARASRPVPLSPEARALLAPLTEGSVVQGWTLQTLTSEREGGVNLVFANGGRTIDERLVLWAQGGPAPPVRVPPYVVYYNAHGDLEALGFSLARAVGEAVRPHAGGPVPADFRPH